jgi:hypothetical protein
MLDGVAAEAKAPWPTKVVSQVARTVLGVVRLSLPGHFAYHWWASALPLLALSSGLVLVVGLFGSKSLFEAGCVLLGGLAAIQIVRALLTDFVRRRKGIRNVLSVLGTLALLTLAVIGALYLREGALALLDRLCRETDAFRGLCQ